MRPCARFSRWRPSVLSRGMRGTAPSMQAADVPGAATAPSPPELRELPSLPIVGSLPYLPIKRGELASSTFKLWHNLGQQQGPFFRCGVCGPRPLSHARPDTYTSAAPTACAGHTHSPPRHTHALPPRPPRKTSLRRMRLYSVGVLPPTPSAKRRSHVPFSPLHAGCVSLRWAWCMCSRTQTRCPKCSRPKANTPTVSSSHSGHSTGAPYVHSSRRARAVSTTLLTRQGRLANLSAVHSTPARHPSSFPLALVGRLARPSATPHPPHIPTSPSPQVCPRVRLVHRWHLRIRQRPMGPGRALAPVALLHAD
jgi:hypothetical protein